MLPVFAKDGTRVEAFLAVDAMPTVLVVDD